MTEFNRIRLGGPSVTGETWSTHLDFAIANTLPVSAGYESYDILLEWAQNLASNAFWTTANPLRALLSTALSLGYVRAECIEDGIVTQVAEVTGLNHAGTGNMSKVPQTALVISYLTGRPGRSYRGRAYWPACGATISTSTGRLTSPSTNLVATSFLDLTDQVIDSCPGANAVVPVVYSGKLNLVTPVTQYSVGDVLDTQRRRRDTLVETRSTVDV